MNDFNPFRGVLPAITTPFDTDGQVDHAALATHAQHLVGAGCRGVIPLGSLGEGATLAPEEKSAVVRTLIQAVGHEVPVIVAVAAPSTRQAVDFAREAEKQGAQGLMILPPYVYPGDPVEMERHVGAVFEATPLPGMLYNNPIAYHTDFLPEAIVRLARAHPNLCAVKESSGDIRRIHALRACMGDALALLVGVDDLLVESVQAGATGWVAGLANAFPTESVRLFDLARAGPGASLDTLYHWFLPLLRLDAEVHFVQAIKLAQASVGLGSERVRPPRLPLAGDERAAVLALIEAARIGGAA